MMPPIQDEILDSDFPKLTTVTVPAKSPRPLADSSSEERRKPGRRPLPPDELAKKRVNGLYKTLMEYQVDNRNIIDIFVNLPSKKDYPDYYTVITDPIDMATIEVNLKEGKVCASHDNYNKYSYKVLLCLCCK